MKSNCYRFSLRTFLVDGEMVVVFIDLATIICQNLPVLTSVFALECIRIFNIMHNTPYANYKEFKLYSNEMYL